MLTYEEEEGLHLEPSDFENSAVYAGEWPGELEAGGEDIWSHSIIHENFTECERHCTQRCGCRVNHSIPTRKELVVYGRGRCGEVNPS